MAKALLTAWEVFRLFGDIAWFTMGCIGVYATIRCMIKGKRTYGLPNITSYPPMPKVKPPKTD